MLNQMLYLLVQQVFLLNILSSQVAVALELDMVAVVVLEDYEPIWLEQHLVAEHHQKRQCYLVQQPMESLLVLVPQDLTSEK